MKKLYQTEDGAIFADYGAAYDHEKSLHGVKTYRVILYFEGHYFEDVEAESEEEAYSKVAPYPEEIDFNEVKREFMILPED